MAATHKKTAKKAATTAAKSSSISKVPKNAIKGKSRRKTKAGGHLSINDQAESNTGFRFLDLPAEIRNSIYELALKSDTEIIVDDQLELPPLLASCPEVHDEACSIWYRDNEFRAKVKDCNADSLNKWTQHCCTVGQRDYFNVSISLLGDIKWENLLKWCEAVWKDDKARVLVAESGTDEAMDEELDEEDVDDEERVVFEAHRIAMNHKGKSWKACARVLEDLRIEEEWLGRGDLIED